ncbi:probable E3 ubiquitin-protein ligase HIP1 isoform X2 [Oryza brachyantha]|uniref:probable E3 ubiquitin-protein ligase HIP1 isoform X2 n=1 Tax=Oryza brachyantha TaxID=4533 RepID=UPI0003EAD3CC|nr:probable E3 ubiquitin-protein ligase HIP1 isoform X2 [Oryza brachyantha]
MAGHQYNNSKMSRMDHMDRLNNEPPPFGQKYMHPRSDPANGAGSSGCVGTTMRSNDLPSSSYAGQAYGQQNRAPVHASYSGHAPAGSSSGSYAPYNTQHMPALNYPHGLEDNFIPSSHVDGRRVALKRRNPINRPTDGFGAGNYYAGSSSNPQFSHPMPPNPIPPPETCVRMHSHVGSSHWNDHFYVNHEGSQRNVRGRHDHSSVHFEQNPATACPSSNISVPPYHPNANGPFRSTPVQRDRAPLTVHPRILPPGTDGSSSIAFRERPHYPAPQSTNISAPVPTLPSSCDSAPFAHGGYVPRSAHCNNLRTYPPPAFVPSNSGVVSNYPPEPALPSYPPAAPSYPPAISAASSSVQPFHAEAAASLRHPRHVSVGPSGSAWSRRMRDSYHGFHHMMIEDNNLGRSTAELVIHESREAFDPHWDMRLDIDDMSYEELLALEERIGNVNTGLADEKISGCVMEIACCSNSHLQDQDTERCVICLEEYKHEDSLGRLKCGHGFHSNCIKKWLQLKNTCPVCKAAAADDFS